MNPPISNSFATVLLSKVAHTAYSEGRPSDAAKIYADSVERSRENRNNAAEMDAKRWQGNSLMWSGRHEEALLLLLEVATCERPDVHPASIFGAKTDCIMLSLFHANASACRELIADAEKYLSGIGKTHWRHRLDLLTCMSLMKQGRFAEAATAIAPAYRRVQAAVDGPKYSNFSYIKWNVRPAFFLQDEEALAHWEGIADQCSFMMISDRLRKSCIKLFRARLQRTQGYDSSCLLAEARQAAILAQASQEQLDETIDIARGLMLAGDLDIFARMPVAQVQHLRFDRAALEADLQINTVRRRLGLPLWDADLNWPAEMPAPIDSIGKLSPNETIALNESMVHLDEIARSEDKRMETTYYSAVTGLRRKQADALMKVG